MASIFIIICLLMRSNGEFTPKSHYTPKSPKGDFENYLVFKAFPSGIKGKKALKIR